MENRFHNVNGWLFLRHDEKGPKDSWGCDQGGQKSTTNRIQRRFDMLHFAL